MKIAMFGHKHIPSREGGVEIVAEELSTRMAARGCRVTCYNRSGSAVCGPAFDGSRKWYRGVRLRRVPTVDRKGLAAVTASFFASMACSLSDAQVVHIHGEGPAAMCFLPRIFGKRVVVTVHGLDWQREKWKKGIGSRYIRWGEKMAVRHAHEIIVLSRAMQRYFLEHYGRETTYIPNGVNPPEKCGADHITALYGLEPEEYILFLGRLVPEKGVHCLIEAYQQLDTDKKLVIAGGPSDTEDYERRLKHLAGENTNILFTGFVQSPVLEELYSNAWAYVLPSMLEGMPLGLLEAMSYGCRCVVSDIPECTEVAAGYARVFPRGDAAALAACLQSLLEEPDAAGKADAARYILETYSWDKTVDRTLALYRKGENREDSADP